MNYSVILVEDEIPARTVFRHMLEQRPGLLTLVAEAEDGRDGLALFLRHKPQFLVTDITMPGMNGLEMLQEMERSGLPLPQVVILTCHQDFHYAQQAIQLKAAAYLIKDDCLTDPDLLPRTLEELARQLESRDDTREKQLELEQKVRSNEIGIEQSQFLDMLRTPAAEARWFDSLAQAGIPAAAGSFKVLLLELDRSSLRFSIDQAEELKLWQFAGVNVLRELLEDAGARHKVIALDKGRFFAFYAGEREANGPSLPDKIQHAFAAYLKMSSFALECAFDPLDDRRPERIRRLASAAYPFFYSGRQGARIGDWERLNRFRHMPEPLGRFWVKVLKQALLEPHRSAATLEQERSSFYRQAMEQDWDPEQIKSLYLRVFLDLSHFMTETEAGTELAAAFRKKLEQGQTFDAVHDTTFTYFRQLQQLQGDTSTIDASIANIIGRMHEDLSYPYKLEELAASISYSVPYFSSMFKKTAGESFIHYLTRQRLEKAKLLLLTTDQKTFEIADAIGFENYRSFNRLFKKETGLTPSDYRRLGASAEPL